MKEGVLFEALAYIVHIRKILVSTLKMAIENFEVKMYKRGP